MWINVEENTLRAWLARLFMGRLRKSLKGEEEWARYFLVRRGLSEELRHKLGMENARVGYVYLLDWKCRIRWAGSAIAVEGEREALRKGAEKLVEEWRSMREQIGREQKQEQKAPNGKSLRGVGVRKTPLTAAAG